MIGSFIVAPLIFGVAVLSSTDTSEPAELDATLRSTTAFPESPLIGLRGRRVSDPSNPATGKPRENDPSGTQQTGPFTADIFDRSDLTAQNREDLGGESTSCFRTSQHGAGNKRV